MNKLRSDATPLNPYKTLLPANWDYYLYNGSLSVPPCTQNVWYVVLKTPVSISIEQRDAFRATISAVQGNKLLYTPAASAPPFGVALPWASTQGLNSRMPQRLFNRTVYEYPRPGFQPQVPTLQANKVFAPLPSAGFVKSVPLSVVGCGIAALAVAAMFGYLLATYTGNRYSALDQSNLIERANINEMYPGTA